MLSLNIRCCCSIQHGATSGTSGLHEVQCPRCGDNDCGPREHASTSGQRYSRRGSVSRWWCGSYLCWTARMYSDLRERDHARIRVSLVRRQTTAVARRHSAPLFAPAQAILLHPAAAVPLSGPLHARQRSAAAQGAPSAGAR